MYKYILCLYLCLCSVLCDLNKEEGAECEWEGVKGTCVQERRCITTLDDRSPKLPVCSRKGEETIVCCTDCELVNDTSNVVISPTAGIFWKDGSKARDNCLQYLKELPYQCRQDGYYGGLTRILDAKNKCHKYYVWAIGGSPPIGSVPSAKYPHQVLLGYGDKSETAEWLAGGSIISDRYILTAAHANSHIDNGDLNFVALNVLNRSHTPSYWQTYKVKRFIAYPEYKSPAKYHDIALIETETPIRFNNNVLPACLIVSEAQADKAVATTWRDLKADFHTLADTIQTINMEIFSEEECKAAYSPKRHLKEGYVHTTQMCYGSKTNPSESCRGFTGEPLLIKTQFSRCMYTIIGVTSFGTSRCGTNSVIPVYTRVSHYVPWIESIVWP